MRRNIVNVMILALMVIVTSGCSMKFFDGHKEQSAFTAPNSNVETIGSRVTGKASKTVVYPFGSTLATPSWSGDMLNQAYSDAMKGTDSDLLVNVDVLKKATFIPLLIVTIITSEVEVEGQPAKVIEIGKQELK